MRIQKILQRSKKPIKKTDLFAYHYVMMASPENDNNHKESRAYNAFFHSTHGRFWKHKDFYFQACDPSYDFYNQPRDHKIPEFRHLSIFEFFNHVGYDNAKKNFA